RCLARCYRRGGGGNAADNDALAKLRELADVQHRLSDHAGRRDTLRLLAERHAALKQYDAAFRCLTGAMLLHLEHYASDRLTAGELCDELAEVKGRLRDQGARDRLPPPALDHSRAVMKDGALSRTGQGGALTAYWRLYQLYQRGNQFRQALELSQAQERDGGPLLQPKLRAEMGTLQTFLGSYSSARSLLQAA